MTDYRCGLQLSGNRLRQYRLFSDFSKETVTFEGEIIAEVETPIFMFPKTRNWNKRVSRLYKTNDKTYIYQCVDQWSRYPSKEAPHQNVMKFDDTVKMLCVLLHDYGDHAVLDADARLLFTAMENDGMLAEEIEALNGRPASRKTA